MRTWHGYWKRLAVAVVMLSAATAVGDGKKYSADVSCSYSGESVEVAVCLKAEGNLLVDGKAVIFDDIVMAGMTYKVSFSHDIWAKNAGDFILALKVRNSAGKVVYERDAGKRRILSFP